MRFVGPGTYQMLFKTGGWIEGVEPVGFGPSDRYDLDGNGRKLIVTVTPRPGQPREIAFSLRPQGAPVWLEGTRDGRPLAPADFYIAQEGHPSDRGAVQAAGDRIREGAHREHLRCLRAKRSPASTCG